MTSQIGAAISPLLVVPIRGWRAGFSLAVGCIVGYTGNYNLPFVPMVLTLSIGTVIWMTIDPAHQVFEERESLAA
jgi:hypothetical protein